MANDFLPHATGAGSNVIAQAAYSALAARLTGFQAGVAKSNEVNKALRQSTSVAAMIGQFISDRAALDALDDGNIAVLQTRFELALGRRVKNTIIQAVAGTYTWTKPAWCVAVEIELLGGGGGGGGAASSSGASSFSSGGGGGAWLRKFLLASALGATESYTVGTAGIGSDYNGGAGANGTAGGTSLFGSILSCTGGARASNMAVASATENLVGSVGGIATGGDINVPGGPGGSGQRYSALVGKAGDGGTTPYCMGTIGAAVSQNGFTGTGPGGGGCGASSTNGTAGTGSFKGGDGKPGLIIIREML